MFPKQIQGIIFTEVIPQLTPEISASDLIKLGSLVRKANRVTIYLPLTYAFRKIQWTKLLALEANSIIDEISKAQSPGVIVGYPYGQMKHSIAVTDSILHTKSALDSMAVFLTNLLGLSAKGGDRDLKEGSFRTAILNHDDSLGTEIQKFQPWFDELQEIRNEWIHRSTIRSMLIIGPSECGPLPIPRKDLEKGLDAFGPPIGKDRFYSTQEFLDHHYSNLVNLFNKIMVYCIQKEAAIVGQLAIDPDVEKHLAMFPLLPTQNMKIETLRSKRGPYGW